jgi:hypothetical protein
MTDQLTNVFREYLLAFDEVKKVQIKNNLSEKNFEIFSGIERAFLTDTHIDKIIKDFSLTQFQDEIRNLHAEFYLELAELHSEGKINKEIETLLSSNNQTFKKTITLFPNETAFLKELSIAIDDAQTEKLIKGYAKVDEWRESNKPNQKNAVDVISIRKVIIKYAIAAAVVGVLIGGFYMNSLNKEELTDNSIVARIEIPNLIESIESNKSIIVENRGSGFAKIDITKNIITIQQNGLSKQIDTLEAILGKMNTSNIDESNKTNSNIYRQIDSVLNILNTYTYDIKNKKIVLNVAKVNVVNSIISLNPSNLTEFYINIEGIYYLIKKTEAPLKLYSISDKNLIDKLKRIEILN